MVLMVLKPILVVLGVVWRQCSEQTEFGTVFQASDGEPHAPCFVLRKLRYHLGAYFGSIWGELEVV